MSGWIQVKHIGTFPSSTIQSVGRCSGSMNAKHGAACLDLSMQGVGGFFPLQQRHKRQGPKRAMLRPCPAPSRSSGLSQAPAPALPIKTNPGTLGTLVRLAMLLVFGLMGMAFGAVRSVGAHVAMGGGGCESFSLSFFHSFHPSR
jgi:hypothetical protein